MSGTQTKTHDPTMTFSAFDVVVVPFPFTDRLQAKRRPALVISRSRPFNSRSGHSIMAMITSQSHEGWPLDVDITNLDAAGLPAPSIVRMKLFTLDHGLVLRKIGKLSRADSQNVKSSLRQLLPLSR